MLSLYLCQRKGLRVLATACLAVFLFLSTCVHPQTVAGATPGEKTQESEITLLSITMFYAGLFGFFLGSIIGCGSWLFTPRGQQDLPDEEEEE
ncbi:hypothetical protein JW933_05415 [candidate division FCPU426 bacterium]|nr:hypothetical protein [candidate division FCPU426 bacterium]